jgi:glycosyltransferase involved in cell wall biosynthesis
MARSWSSETGHSEALVADSEGPAAHVSARSIPPRVAIGLCVYNGEQFLSQQLESLLGQTFTDFEIIISDNVSTDGTEEICRAYAARDPRVRYFRNEKNLGVNPNYRRAFERSSSEYFKWAAHDDVHAPGFLEKCVEVLDQDASVVLCYSKAVVIDEQGRQLRPRVYGLDTQSPRMRRARNRLRAVLAIPLGSPPIYGLIRAKVLRKTGLLGSSYAADQILLAELALHGRFHEIPEELLLHREHGHRSVYDHPSRHALTRWVEPAKATRFIFPSWRLLRDYLRSLRHAPLELGERLACSLEMARWARNHQHELAEDLKIAARELAHGSRSQREQA